MINKNFQVYFDCGFSKIRAGAFNKNNPNEIFFKESKFFFDQSDIDQEIQKIVTFLEKKTGQYIDDVNLMIDSSKMMSIGISVVKKLEGPKLKKEDVQFMIQEAKQQISKNYRNKNIVHIIINNYKINNIDYSYLPNEIECNLISLDILFICIPNEIIDFFKKTFLKSDISINQIFCSSYAKAINCKDNLGLTEDVSFIDVGFNKTSIICFSQNKIVSIDVLPIGGNHITKDISKILKIKSLQAEDIKINFSKNITPLSEFFFSVELLQKIVFARTEEILELSTKSIKLNLPILNQFKMILMGEGSKILDNEYKDKISFSNDIDFLEETTQDICYSGLKLDMGLNKHEVIIVPKKQIKHGFFEKLFHFFK
tara:strand:- start:549 stop:1658 length:1110 start_codon:yes stop_codon:yes gene_type:complete